MKILLLEDDSGVRLTLSCLLRFCGHEAVAIENGNEGLHVYNSGFDAILCDIEMPVMGGIEFFKCLKQRLRLLHQALLPFIFISAYVTPEIVDKIQSLGADCILKKPIDASVLCATLMALSNDSSSNKN